MNPIARTRISMLRLDQVMAWSLKSGAHEKNDDGNACVMEAVAYVAGRNWGDSPPCVCPILGSFMRAWNDGLPTDADRDRLLKPFIPKLIGTKFDEAVEQRRGFMAGDWLVRVCVPKFLELVPALAPHASALRNLEEIADMAGFVAATGKLSAAREASAAARAAAWDAARDAARAAAWDAAGAAARAAAWDAAWDAARDAAWAAAWAAARAAARDAARAAARDAARAAAWDAAWDAAWATLKPTTEFLQQSAVHLVNRMIEAGNETH